MRGRPCACSTWQSRGCAVRGLFFVPKTMRFITNSSFVNLNLPKMGGIIKFTFIEETYLSTKISDEENKNADDA